jgi:hypothetical protein
MATEAAPLLQKIYVTDMALDLLNLFAHGKL